MIRLGLGLVLATAIGVGAQQKPADTPRIAALRFALQNDLPLLGPVRAIVRESQAALVHDPTSIVRRVGVNNAQEGVALARELNRSGRVGDKAELLRCVKESCVAAGQESVIEVFDASRSTSGVSASVAVYAPSDKPYEYDGIVVRAVIELQERGEGWIGVRYIWGPKSTPVRLPKK